MSIQIGNLLPEGTLFESSGFDEDHGCPLKPVAHLIPDITRDRKIVLFAVPGAFTPTCSAQHLPGYVHHYEAFKAKGVDEIWCLSVNDAFVMAAWGRERGATGKVRMMADGSATYTMAMGMQQDLTAKGMGIRSLRYAMVVVDGRITHLAMEPPGQFGISTAESVLAQL